MSRQFSRNIIPYFFPKLGKMSENLSSAAIVIGALRVKLTHKPNVSIVGFPYSNFDSRFCYQTNSGYHYQTVFGSAWSCLGLLCSTFYDAQFFIILSFLYKKFDVTV